MRGRHVAIIAFLVAVWTSACATNHDARLAASRAIMPVLAGHGVIDFIWTDECEFIAHARGVFSTDPTKEACDLHVTTPGRRLPIDDETREILDQIYGEAEAVGPRVTDATVTIVDGQVASGVFGFDLDAYWFEPGYTSMEDDDWFCETKALDADWYVWDC
jgi:hypothetical protein